MTKLHQKIIVISLAFLLVCFLALSTPFSYTKYKANAKGMDKNVVTVSSKYSWTKNGISPHTAYNYPFYLAKLDPTSKGKNHWKQSNIKHYNHNVVNKISNDLNSYKQETGINSVILMNTKDNFLEKLEFFANTKPHNLGNKIKNSPISDETDLFFANVGAKFSF